MEYLYLEMTKYNGAASLSERQLVDLTFCRVSVWHR
jgi:hypothetical protein